MKMVVLFPILHVQCVKLWLDITGYLLAQYESELNNISKNRPVYNPALLLCPHLFLSPQRRLELMLALHY